MVMDSHTRTHTHTKMSLLKVHHLQNANILIKCLKNAISCSYLKKKNL